MESKPPEISLLSFVSTVLTGEKLNASSLEWVRRTAMFNLSEGRSAKLAVAPTDSWKRMSDLHAVTYLTHMLRMGRGCIYTSHTPEEVTRAMAALLPSGPFSLVTYDGLRAYFRWKREVGLQTDPLREYLHARWMLEDSLSEVLAPRGFSGCGIHCTRRRPLSVWLEEGVGTIVPPSSAAAFLSPSSRCRCNGGLRIPPRSRLVLDAPKKGRN